MEKHDEIVLYDAENDVHLSLRPAKDVNVIIKRYIISFIYLAHIMCFG